MSELFSSASSAPPRATPFVGRGAMPLRDYVATLDRPNPTRHLHLRFRYRVARHWHTWTQPGPAQLVQVLAGSRLDQAECLVLHFFRVIGGLLTAHDADVRTAYDALESYTHAQLLAAIDAKVRSDPNRAFTPRLQNFFRDPEFWVAKSGIRMREKARAAGDARRAQQLTEREREQAEIDAEFAQLASAADSTAKILFAEADTGTAKILFAEADTSTAKILFAEADTSTAKILFASLSAKAAARFPARRGESPAQRSEREYQIRRAVVYAHRQAQMPRLLDEFGRLLPPKQDGEDPLRPRAQDGEDSRDGEDSLRPRAREAAQ